MKYNAQVHYPFIPACLWCINRFVAIHWASYVASAASVCNSGKTHKVI